MKITIPMGTLVALAACSAMLGCSRAQPSNLTAGQLKRNVTAGETDQLRVIEVFGLPNIVTMRDGSEVFIYDKVSSAEASNFFGIGGAGGTGGSGSAGIAGAGLGRRSSKRSETTVMLIVYFDENGIVQDYRLSQTKF